ncbi:MAG: [FeFe] hydrogenase H-cluster radical SAM maturase HydE [Proteobacteria bacterium]|nr:[FeFe] hydrogenase H-cluster radical SAM maturase HydE [Pseudomonadota bacterium]
MERKRLDKQYGFAELDYSFERIMTLFGCKGEELEKLYKEADRIRQILMGNEIYIRGIIEFSNNCANDCLYCGIRASNHAVNRYTMTSEEILTTARAMIFRQQTTVVLQSGETPGINDREIGNIILRIKEETPLAVTVSVGNRPYETYRYWKDCGMDRYLLRFETSDPELFRRLHPDCTLEERLACLYALKELGVQTGSGFMIGLPGETHGILARNILLCRELDLDMIGIGPFIPHPDTPLGKEKNAYEGDGEIFFKALAVLRIFNPDAHIPATTAYDAVFPGEGRNLALQRGANVFMPNDTPVKHRKDYLLYPGKPCIDEGADHCAGCVLMRIESLGRDVGKGPGHSMKLSANKTTSLRKTLHA